MQEFKYWHAVNSCVSFLDSIFLDRAIQREPSSTTYRQKQKQVFRKCYTILYQQKNTDAQKETFILKSLFSNYSLSLWKQQHPSDVHQMGWLMGYFVKWTNDRLVILHVVGKYFQFPCKTRKGIIQDKKK